jgi:flagellar protein FlaJ
MRSSKILEKTKALLFRIRALLRPLPTSRTERKELTEPSEKLRISSRAYLLIGDRVGRFLPLFKDLDSNLQKSGMKANFKAYVSLSLLTTLIASTTALICIPCALFFATEVPLLPAFLFGLGGSLFTIAFSVIGFYIYPVYRSDVMKRKLEDELPFTTAYMAILTGAGVSPERIFQSMSNLSAPLAASAEAKDIVRDVNLFGLDIISALQKASKRTPSEKFREVTEGLILTMRSGGDLATYLREKTRQYMKLKRIGLRKYSDTLSILSEFYVALLLTGPLLLVIMLSVMAMLGGGNLGILSPDLLLRLLTYMAIPLGAVVFLIILDTLSPKW